MSDEVASPVSRTPTSRGLGRASWRFAATRAWHGFMRHRGIDSAAALTFFATLSMFPAALTVVSAFAVVRDRERALDSIIGVIDEVATKSAVDTIRGPLTEFLSISSPGLALTVGLVIGLWSLSAYATAFGRAMNSVYEVQEGRQLWKFRGLMMLVTLVLIVAFAAITVILLATSPVAASVGESLGVAPPWITVWNIGKWPALAALAVLVVGTLYYYTPNVRHTRRRWVSWGASFAIIAWLLATAGFALYISTVGQYDRVYGWLGGGVVLLLWIYLSNLVLVLGAEVDAEIVRLRQLTAGIAAEITVQLPLRDTTRNLLLARQRADDERRGRDIRLAATAQFENRDAAHTAGARPDRHDREPEPSTTEKG
jgi:membrane protein